MVQKRAVKLQYVSIDEQIAKIFTKPMSRMKLKYFMENIGMMQNVSLVEREC
jgi:hypothetical protein